MQIPSWLRDWWPFSLFRPTLHPGFGSVDDQVSEIGDEPEASIEEIDASLERDAQDQSYQRAMETLNDPRLDLLSAFDLASILHLQVGLQLIPHMLDIGAHCGPDGECTDKCRQNCERIRILTERQGQLEARMEEILLKLRGRERSVRPHQSHRPHQPRSNPAVREPRLLRQPRTLQRLGR